MRRTIAILLLACLAFAMAGCGKIIESATKKAVEAGTGVSVDKDGEEVTVKTDEGEATMGGGEGKLPEGFPKGFPTPDGAKVEFGSRMGSNDEWTYTVTYRTDEPQKDIAKFYQDELPDAGWPIKNTMEAQEATYLTIEKDADNTGSVMVSKDTESDSTVILVTLVLK